MQDRWWKSRWFMSKICSMLFADYIAVEQEVIVTVIMIAFSIFSRFWCTPTHIQSKPSIATLLQDTDYRSWSTKLTPIKDVDRIQFFSDWLTYVADNVEARIPPYVWNCLDFISLNASEMKSLQTCACFTHLLYTKCENGCVFAETKPQSILTTALEWS